MLHDVLNGYDALDVNTIVDELFSALRNVQLPLSEFEDALASLVGTIVDRFAFCCVDANKQVDCRAMWKNVHVLNWKRTNRHSPTRRASFSTLVRFLNFLTFLSFFYHFLTFFIIIFLNAAIARRIQIVCESHTATIDDVKERAAALAKCQPLLDLCLLYHNGRRGRMRGVLYVICLCAVLIAEAKKSSQVVVAAPLC